MLKKLTLSLAVATLSLATSAFAQVIASDNFENDNPSNAYNDGIQYNDNGGSGYGALTYLEGMNGGLFDAGGISGTRSLGIFAGSDAGATGQALGRAITSPIAAGIFSLDARFDVNNAVGTTGFNLKSGLGTSLGGGELLFVGLTPGSGNGLLFISDASGSRTLSLGTATELRGQNIGFSIGFDTAVSTYSLTATILSSGQTGTISGALKPGAFNAVGLGNFNLGADQNFIVDNMIVAVPEPSSLSLLAGPAILGAWFFVRRRRS